MALHKPLYIRPPSIVTHSSRSRFLTLFKAIFFACALVMPEKMANLVALGKGHKANRLAQLINQNYSLSQVILGQPSPSILSQGHAGQPQIFCVLAGHTMRAKASANSSADQPTKPYR